MSKLYSSNMDTLLFSTQWVLFFFQKGFFWDWYETGVTAQFLRNSLKGTNATGRQPEVSYCSLTCKQILTDDAVSCELHREAGTKVGNYRVIKNAWTNHSTGTCWLSSKSSASPPLRVIGVFLRAAARFICLWGGGTLFGTVGDVLMGPGNRNTHICISTLHFVAPNSNRIYAPD